MINKLSKERYFNYDSKELLGVMRFDFYDGRISNQWSPRDLIIELNNRSVGVNINWFFRTYPYLCYNMYINLYVYMRYFLCVIHQ